jgi:RNA polymerase sigma-70 factor (ECF subfamily)
MHCFPIGFQVLLAAMEHSSLGTTVIHEWVARIQAGDRAAQDELLRRTVSRLEHLCSLMLAREPRLRALVEPGDVLQNAALRLLKSLQSVKPGSVREFYGLAATHIRRELIDLTRYFDRQRRPPLVSVSPQGQDSTAAAWDPAAESVDGNELDKWCRFHQAAEELPVEEREAFGLTYYHGWTQAEAAELFGVSERTVRRWLQSAMLKLHRALKEGGA